jgi:hypothetical protein
MTQDYSVEICGSEEPDPAAAARRTQAAGAHEISYGGGGTVAEVDRRLGGGQEGRVDALGGGWHSLILATKVAGVAARASYENKRRAEAL